MIIVAVLFLYGLPRDVTGTIEHDIPSYGYDSLFIHAHRSIGESGRSIEVDDVMYRIAICESGNRQLEDSGKVLRNKTSSATGRFQIMGFWRPLAESMDMDIDTWEGNTAFALYLYEKYGTKPWLASVKCWISE